VCVTFSSHPVLEQQLVLATAPRSFFTVGYENAEFFSTELVNAFLKPVIGTAAAADRFQELNAGLGSVDLLAPEPALRNLRVLTQIACCTDDEFFNLNWVYRAARPDSHRPRGDRDRGRQAVLPA
jgi:hypothetical protein